MPFSHPSKPQTEACQNGYLILRNAIDVSNSFLETFETIRSKKRAKGMPADREQDLLRAMLAFASSGLDALVKQLVRDALSSIINIDEGANKMFETFVERHLKKGEGIDRRLLAETVSNKDPRSHLVKLLIKNLTSSSLQSTEELFRAASYFNMPSENIAKDKGKLSKIFRARNQIAHEMDVDLLQKNGNRRPRERKLMEDYTNEIFHVSQAFLDGVDQQASNKNKNK